MKIVKVVDINVFTVITQNNMNKVMTVLVTLIFNFILRSAKFYLTS